MNDSVLSIDSLDPKTLTILYNMEQKILAAGLEPELSKTVRFCAAHVALQAIAHTKKAKPDKILIRELFAISRDLLALGGADDVDNARLTDLVNALIDAEDVPITIRRCTDAVIARIHFSEGKIERDLALMKEDNIQILKAVDDNRKALEKANAPRSIYKTFLIAVASAGIIGTLILFCIIMVSAFLINVSQPEKEGVNNNGKAPFSQQRFIQQQRFEQ